MLLTNTCILVPTSKSRGSFVSAKLQVALHVAAVPLGHMRHVVGMVGTVTLDALVLCVVLRSKHGKCHLNLVEVLCLAVTICH